MKKAQGMSLQTVVLAALALVVLIVLILIFSGKIGGFSEETSRCVAPQVPCEAGQTNGGLCSDGKLPSRVFTDEGTTYYCCSSCSGVDGTTLNDVAGPGDGTRVA